jgi:hypothetical protein
MGRIFHCSVTSIIKEKSKKRAHIAPSLKLIKFGIRQQIGNMMLNAAFKLDFFSYSVGIGFSPMAKIGFWLTKKSGPIPIYES